MKYEFEVQTYKDLGNPYNKKGQKLVYLFVHAKDLPENLSFGPNPREQNMKTAVAKKIIGSLQEGTEQFYVKNRGITIHASEIKFIPSKSLVEIDLPENDMYGVLDGGHSYKAILENRMVSKDGGQECVNEFVKIEVIVGAEEYFEQLAASRNTSVQVTDSTIAELEKRFDFIKNVLNKKPYFNKISFKQNEQKDIEVIDILRLMYAFNLAKFPDHTSVGVSAYTSPKAVLNDFLADVKKAELSNTKSEYEAIAKILPDIIELYDLIEKDAGCKYKEANKAGKYGAIKGVDGKEGDKKHYSKFTAGRIDYKSPVGFIFPIISSFKALVEKDVYGNYYWICDPKLAWDKNGAELMAATVERSTSLGSNPQSTGKDTGLWKQNLSVNYITALTEKAKKL